MRYRMTVALVAAAALLLPGCGNSDRKPTFPVTGKVVWEGQPAKGAMVVLHPAGPDDGTPKPRGQVKDDGTFTLTTYAGGDGAPEGAYKVTVEWWLSPGGDEPPTNQLDARFGKPGESGLEAKVEKGPNELKTIELNP